MATMLATSYTDKHIEKKPHKIIAIWKLILIKLKVYIGEAHHLDL